MKRRRREEEKNGRKSVKIYTGRLHLHVEAGQGQCFNYMWPYVIKSLAFRM